MAEWTWTMLAEIGLDQHPLLKDIPLEELTTDMVIIVDCLEELKSEDNRGIRKRVCLISNIFMCIPGPNEEDNTCCFFPAVSSYLFGDEDVYSDPAPIL